MSILEYWQSKPTACEQYHGQLGSQAGRQVLDLSINYQATINSLQLSRSILHRQNNFLFILSSTEGLYGTYTQGLQYIACKQTVSTVQSLSTHWLYHNWVSICCCVRSSWTSLDWTPSMSTHGVQYVDWSFGSVLMRLSQFLEYIFSKKRLFKYCFQLLFLNVALKYTSCK